MEQTKMSRRQIRFLIFGLLAVVVIIVTMIILRERDPSVGGDGRTVLPSETHGQITTQRIIEGGTGEPGSWLAHGRDYSEQRHSPLTQITHDNISRLGLTWQHDMNTRRGLESSPIVVDGVMYVTGSWSVVYALDAQTGDELWYYDPSVSRDWARYACCDVVNRGVAVYDGAVYVATLDGYLVSLNAETGEEIWRQDTLIDRGRPYTITGAPRVANGRIFIGNGGAEYGVRGYLSAYDTRSGNMLWRFFTVPGDPNKPFEHPEMELAAKTWKGGEWWKIGGGGTVWNTLVYDPDTDTLFAGTGNGSPWTRTIRSPGGGDNLYLSSILALDPSNGRLKWHYQVTPGDTWDYTATQDLMLADLEVDGMVRKVIMQAPKNGFFYVLDRTDGKLLRANPYVAVTWADRIDLETGRPVENPQADWLSGETKWVLPGPLGGHNWQAMSFNPATGLVYIPALENPFIYDVDNDFKATGRLKYVEGGWNTGVEFGRLLANINENPSHFPPPRGYLVAFDPLTGKAHWQYEHATHWNGGTLSTASGLIFQGNSDGYFNAYDADTGSVLWQANTYTSIIAPPITYMIDGVQYVAIQIGSGGTSLVTEGDGVAPASARYGNAGQLMVFKLDGKMAIAEPELIDRTIPEPPRIEASPETIALGNELYHEVCVFCHGIAGVGSIATADLRLMSPEVNQSFEDIVFRGDLVELGMPNFSDRLSQDDIAAIYAFINARAWEDYQAQQAAK